MKPQKDDRNILMKILDNIAAGILFLPVILIFVVIIGIFFWIVSFAGGGFGPGWIFVVLALITIPFAVWHFNKK